jgi:integrase
MSAGSSKSEATMASVEDRWYRTVKKPDGTTAREQSDRHGKGRRYRVHYTDPDGRQRSESFFDGEKRKADKFARDVSSDVDRGAYIDPDAGTITLRKYAEEIWFPAQTFGPSTRERVETRLRLHILPVLGGSRLAELSRRPSTVQAWIRGLQNAKMEPSGIKLVKGTLSSILGAAIADERIAKNPCKDRSVKVPKPVQRKIVPWTAARVAAIRVGLPALYRAMTDAGAGAGLRQGEVFGLSPDDVDWLRKVVHVRRQVKLVGGRRVFAPPKGGKERDVPLSGTLALRLSAHLAEHPAASVTLPWIEPGGKPVTVALMFTKPDQGAIWRNDWNRYVWHPALKGAGVVPGRENGFHQLRHYYASVSPMGSISAPSPNTSATTTRALLSVSTRTCSPRVLHGRAGPSIRPSLRARIAQTLPRGEKRADDLHRHHFTKI